MNLELNSKLKALENILNLDKEEIIKNSIEFLYLYEKKRSTILSTLARLVMQGKINQECAEVFLLTPQDKLDFEVMIKWKPLQIHQR
ncbi:MAG: hypothetical protein ACE5J9_01375 [Methanosarcinales archaeon]